MNPDYTSQIRQTERFIFEHNLYLLTMFEKKIDSFVKSPISPNVNGNGMNMNGFNRHGRGSGLEDVVNWENYVQEPFKNVSRDLTKPVWNCVTKVQPKIVYQKQRSHMQLVQIINTLNKLLHNFYTRLKNQQQDESPLRLTAIPIEFDSYLQSQPQSQSSPINPAELDPKHIKATTLELFTRLLDLATVRLNRLELGMEDSGIREGQQVAEEEGVFRDRQSCMLMAAKEMFLAYLGNADGNFVNQLDVFTHVTVNNINDVINCNTGSLVITMLPNFKYLPLLIHPLLISVHSLLKSQVLQLQRRQQQRNKKPQPPSYLRTQKQLKLQQIQGQNEQFQSQNLLQNNRMPQLPIFDEIPRLDSVSRVCFLNFDGYESQFNIDLVKYLAKSVMYVSFPREPVGDQPDQDVLLSKSRCMLQKYFYGNLTKQQKQELLKIYKTTQRQQKKNLYIFPLYSPILSSITSQPLPSPLLQTHQSSFISFIMTQLIYNQILEFNPSIIVVSYSQKIVLENEFFVEMMKELTVLGSYRVVFYGNLAKNYLYEEYCGGYAHGKRFLELEKAEFERYETYMRIVEERPYNKQIYKVSNNKVSQVQRICHQTQLNCDIFQKISISLKITSGTHNLQKCLPPQQSPLQKYKNYKAMIYASPLIKKLGEQYQNLNRMRMRLNDYDMIIRVLKNQYEGRKQDGLGKLFTRVVPRFYGGLFKQVQKVVLKGQKPNNQIQEEINQNISIESRKRRMKVNQQIFLLGALLEKKHYDILKSWPQFKMQKLIQVSTQKIQSHFFAHIPPAKPQKSPTSSLICLQFITILQKQIIPIQISPSMTKIYYTRNRKPTTSNPNTLIYLTNHFLRVSSNELTHYCGTVTEEFEVRASKKVLMEPVRFRGGIELTPYETFTEFNYFQTESYVFMFWPKLYDMRKELMCKFYGVTYNAESTGYFYRAHKTSPTNFQMIYNSLQQNAHIIPRHGCQCYQIPNTNTIYIFGGFYSNQKNYMLFQTDISKLTFKNSINPNEDPILHLENIPKSFYFDYVEKEQNKEIKQIKRIKNDMVRPRVQYQFLESQEVDRQGEEKEIETKGMDVENQNQVMKLNIMKQEQAIQIQQPNSSTKTSKHTLYLIGGVGQNYLRPYSMLTCTAHKITFDFDIITQIRRINMHNLIPINTHAPTLMRSSMNTKLLSNAQNRCVSFQQGQSGLGGYAVYNNRIWYDQERDRFQYEIQYDFVDGEFREYREEVSMLKKAISENMYKLTINARSPRTNTFITNYLTLTLTQSPNQTYILQLHLQVPPDSLQKHPTLSETVRLTSSSILSIDVAGALVYALVKHPIYTLDQCMLVYCDVGELMGVRERAVDCVMREMGRFGGVDGNVVVAANQKSVLVVHGQRLDTQVEVPEMLIKRLRKKHLKIQPIQPNQRYSSQSSNSSNRTSISISPKIPKKQLQQLQQYLTNINSNKNQSQNINMSMNPNKTPNIIGGLSCSLFWNQNNGTILCFSFKTIDRTTDYEAVFVIVQRLDLSGDRYFWERIFVRKYEVRVYSQICQGKYQHLKPKARQPLKLLQLQKSPQSLHNPASKNTYQLTALYKEQCVQATLELQSSSNQMNFNSNKKSINQYYKKLATNTTKQYSVYLEKSTEVYNQLREAKKNGRLARLS